MREWIILPIQGCVNITMNNKCLKIAIISDWYSEGMGYAENFLPKALASQGHDVHLITSTAQVYYTSKSYKKTYEPFLGPSVVEPVVKKVDGYTLHRLPLTRAKLSGMPGIEGLNSYLKEISPQIIQVFEIASDTTFIATDYCARSGSKLFIESHTHASVFKGTDKKYALRFLIHAINLLRCYRLKKELKSVNAVATKCYPIAPDVAKIVESKFGIAKEKIEIQSLGVDTSLFYPPNAEFAQKALQLRNKLGLGLTSFVCIYTGRFSFSKKPQCLAKAINRLQQKGLNIEGLFVGNGSENEIEEIKKNKGCFVHKFVPVTELRKFYWLANIGVWPAQESTSQLDAVACGLPIIISSSVEVTERVEGNGLFYREGDEIDLENTIYRMYTNEDIKTMSAIGLAKIEAHFSWNAIAKCRTIDYQRAILE